ncbi:MAG: CaiB/BaiF CoA-transferase family protein [Bacteroidia bacterium]
MERNRIFDGLKVVELASVLAGPAVGLFFAELGADVVKIENKRTGGDVTRQWKLPYEDAQAPASSYYYSVNWNKRVVFADLLQPDDYRLVMDEIATADVLIMNFKEGDERKFGCDAEQLRKQFPSLIIGRITGFADNPARTAFDAVLQAESGLMSMNGEPGGPSLKMPVALIDVISAHQLKEAILIALWKREKTGEGSIAGVALYTAAVVSLMNQSSAFLNTGYVAGKQGSLHPNIAPYGETFLCADQRELLLAVGSDQQFRKLLKLTDSEALATDERFRDNSSRVKHRNELAQLLGAAFRSRPADEWLLMLHQAQVPAAAIRSIKEVFALPENQSLILEQKEPDHTTSRRCSTIAFTLT